MKLVGATTCSLTFDGAPSNYAAAKALGAEVTMDFDAMSFENPAEVNNKVFVFPDPPHCLKLIRNALGQYGTFRDGEGRSIKWDYFSKLVDIQEREGLHLANKITRRHINYKTEIMKVKLAAQIFSRSTAKAIEYLRTNKYPGFKGSLGTEIFSINVDRAFDILNISNKGDEFTLSYDNYNKIAGEVNRLVDYFGKLVYGGQLLTTSRRKLGFIGFIVSLKSSLEIFLSYGFKKLSGGLNYLLTYKLSQDHLELFFASVRSMGGFNNNPTTDQFKAAYKRLIVHVNSIIYNNGNCSPQTPQIMLAVSTSQTVSKMRSLGYSHNLDMLESDNDYDDDLGLLTLDNTESLSSFVSDVVEYVAGFVVRQVKRRLKCLCLNVLEDKESSYKLIDLKNYSKTKLLLNKPSSDVIKICKLVEVEIREAQCAGLVHKINVFQLVTRVLRFSPSSIFKTLGGEEGALHRVELIKLICIQYCKVRLHHLAATAENNTKRVRAKLTKLILFKSQ